MRKAHVGGIAAALVAAVGIALLSAAPASAYVGNGCHATFAGQPIDTLPADEAHAITVSTVDVVPMTMSGKGRRFSNLHIYFTFARWDANIYDAPAGGGTWSHGVDIHSFARYGVGYYILKGVGDFIGGDSCEGSVMIKVTGDPLGTLAGDVALGATVAGVLGVLGAGLSGGGGGGGGGGTEDPYTQADATREEKREQTDRDITDAVHDAPSGPGGWCWLSALAVLIAVPLLLVLGTGAALIGVVAPAVNVRRRPKWPMIVGPISGILTGFGVGVLLQQYAIVYPTRTWAIVYLAGGLLLGFASPMLRRTLSR